MLARAATASKQLSGPEGLSRLYALATSLYIGSLCKHRSTAEHVIRGSTKLELRRSQPCYKEDDCELTQA